MVTGSAATHSARGRSGRAGTRLVEVTVEATPNFCTLRIRRISWSHAGRIDVEREDLVAAE